MINLSYAALGQGRPNRLGPAHVEPGRRSVKGVEFLGGQSNRHDLHRFSPTPRAPTAATLESIDVVAGFGLVGPPLDLIFTHHPHIV
jgi:hypothetical protein